MPVFDPATKCTTATLVDDADRASFTALSCRAKKNERREGIGWNEIELGGGTVFCGMEWNRVMMQWEGIGEERAQARPSFAVFVDCGGGGSKTNTLGFASQAQSKKHRGEGYGRKKHWTDGASSVGWRGTSSQNTRSHARAIQRKGGLCLISDFKPRARLTDVVCRTADSGETSSN